MTAYQYLLDQGVPSKQIVVSGDSAGAGLVVSLTRHIARSNGTLPDLSAALLFSPWLDIKSAREPRYVNGNRNYKTDCPPSSFTFWGAHAYIPDPMDASDPYFSPLEHAFRTTTPLWIQLGVLEVLYDEGMKVAEAMRKEGNRVEVHVEPLANQRYLVYGKLDGLCRKVSEGG